MLGYKFAIIVIALFFLLDNFLRFGKDAQSLKTAITDRGTSNTLRWGIAISIAFILSSYFLNLRNWGLIENKTLFYVGGALCAIGFSIKIIATLTLKEFYTRTLKVSSAQKLIQTGIYKYIRHPGYFGIICIFIGCGLLTTNWMVIIGVLLSIPPAFIKRLLIEEQMLTRQFGVEYSRYMQSTYRLIPYLF